jgi:uncharacterized damage-inducible protein DinB
MTTSVLLELLKHKTWATLKVIELCESLPKEALDEAHPGTYGSIRATLRHLVGADDNYFRLLSGTPRQEPPPEDVSLAELKERFTSLVSAWQGVFEDPTLPDREFTTRVGVTAGVAPLAQSIHHAEVHRTQILSMLGARGVQPPDFDVWEFGTAAGYVKPSVPA